MTHDSAQPSPWPQSAWVDLPARPPGVVQAAAVVTWIVATGTAVSTLFLAVGFLVVAGPVFDTFGPGSDNPRWWIVGAAGTVVALAAAADVVALFIHRGHRWARWVLIGLSVVAALGGLALAYCVAPLVVTAAAVAVVVLLLLPDARAWFRGPQPDRMAAP